jgi:hypothetical protein
MTKDKGTGNEPWIAADGTIHDGDLAAVLKRLDEAGKLTAEEKADRSCAWMTKRIFASLNEIGAHERREVVVLTMRKLVHELQKLLDAAQTNK